MSITRTVNGSTYHVTTNNSPRELVALNDVPPAEYLDAFGWYLDHDELIESGEWYAPRVFKYRGTWYDSHEFEVSGDDLKALGYDGVQTSSYFDAIAIRYFDADGHQYDDAVVVAHIHW